MRTIKKFFYKKKLKRLVKDNKVLLAALGGAIGGIMVTSLLGLKKTKGILQTAKDSISNTAGKISHAAKNGISSVKSKELVS